MQTATPQAFAEIIESSITHATGQSWEWSKLPTLCTLVKVTQAPYTLYGCITNVKTGSSDPTRQPFAFQKTEAELQQEQPQLFAFLQTTFSIQILGYSINDEAPSYLLPPQPAKLHGFIAYASADEYRQFFGNPEFLNLFFMPNEIGIDQDELLLALLRNIRQTIGIHEPFIQALCAYRNSMHTNDYKSSKRFMYRLQQLLSA